MNLIFTICPKFKGQGTVYQQLVVVCYTMHFFIHITYGLEVWGGSNKTLLKPLISLKKKALKLINNNQSRRSAGVNLFKKYNILTLKDLYSRQLSQLMYKAFHNSLPPVIQQLFIRVNSDRNTRQNAYNFRVKQKSTKIQNPRPSISHQSPDRLFGTVFPMTLDPLPPLSSSGIYLRKNVLISTINLLVLYFVL